MNILDQIQFHRNEPAANADVANMDASTTNLAYSNSLLDFEANQYINSTEIVNISLSLLESTLPPNSQAMAAQPVAANARYMSNAQIDVGGDLDENMTDSFTRMQLAETIKELTRNELS